MKRAAQPCRHPGCPETTRDGAYCIGHRRDAENARPSAARRGYGGKSWRQIRRDVLCRDNYHCRSCGQLIGCRPRDAHVDHIVPLAAGGTNELSNLQALCSTCHSSKTATQDGGFGGRS